MRKLNTMKLSPAAVVRWKSHQTAQEKPNRKARRTLASLKRSKQHGAKNIFDMKGPIFFSEEDYYEGEKGVMPEELKSFLEKADGEPIVIRVNSPGGVVYGGTEIRSMLAAYKGKVTAHVVGVAASIAAFVLSGCDKVVMVRGSQIMIHRSWAAGIFMGDHEDIMKDATSMAQSLAKIDESQATVYAEIMGVEPDEVQDLLKEETWFSEDEAVEWGFAEKVSDTVEDEDEKMDEDEEMDEDEKEGEGDEDAEKAEEDKDESSDDENDKESEEDEDKPKNSISRTMYNKQLRARQEMFERFTRNLAA